MKRGQAPSANSMTGPVKEKPRLQAGPGIQKKEKLPSNVSRCCFNRNS
jgi:hypothetical protein